MAKKAEQSEGDLCMSLNAVDARLQTLWRNAVDPPHIIMTVLKVPEGCETLW